MQATLSHPRTPTRGQRSSFKGIARAVRYLTHYGRQAALPYIFLIIATLSQLAVPRMVRNVIDAVTSGYVADQILKVSTRSRHSSSARPCRRFWKPRADPCP